MDIRELSVRGAYELTPDIHGDKRGAFLEWFRADEFEEMTGHRFELAQAGCSLSAAGTIRGLHFAQLPPSQAKYVTCMYGAVLDVVVDIRVGSPTFGEWEAVGLDDVDRKAVYVSEGLAHAFMALEDNTVVSHLCSAPFAPDRERSINPTDSRIGIIWPRTGRYGRPVTPLLSPKDDEAPGLDEMLEAGLLPTYEEVLDYVDTLRSAVR